MVDLWRLWGHDWTDWSDIFLIDTVSSYDEYGGKKYNYQVAVQDKSCNKCHMYKRRKVKC